MKVFHMSFVNVFYLQSKQQWTFWKKTLLNILYLDVQFMGLLKHLNVIPMAYVLHKSQSMFVKFFLNIFPKVIRTFTESYVSH